MAAYVGPNGYHFLLSCLIEKESGKLELLHKKSLWESSGQGNIFIFFRLLTLNSFHVKGPLHNWARRRVGP